MACLAVTTRVCRPFVRRIPVGCLIIDLFQSSNMINMTLIKLGEKRCSEWLKNKGFLGVYF